MLSSIKIGNIGLDKKNIKKKETFYFSKRIYKYKQF